MKIIKGIRKLIQWMVVAFFASTILSVIVLRFVPVYFTPLMFIRLAEQHKEGKDMKLKHHWVSLEKMSPSMPVAVMASEDQRFLKHHGFDYKAIEKATKRNKTGKRMLGASTISQQTAKNVFLGAQGLGSVFHGTHRTDVEQAAHHGGLSELDRDGGWYLWRGGGGARAFQLFCQGAYPCQLCLDSGHPA